MFHRDFHQQKFRVGCCFEVQGFEIGYTQTITGFQFLAVNGDCSQLPHESFRVVHLTKNYKPKQHQETQIIMLILNRKTSQQWLVFVFITKAFVTIEISPIFVMLIPTLRGNITQATHTQFVMLTQGNISQVTQALLFFYAISKCDSSVVGMTKYTYYLSC